MKLSEAVAAQEIPFDKLAAAQDGELEVVVSSDDGHPGMYEIGWWDSMGNTRMFGNGLSLAEIEQRYPHLNWWPIRDEGEWGDEAEAAYQQAQKEK